MTMNQMVIMRAQVIEFSEVASTIDSKQAETNIGTRFNNEDNTSSLNQTKAFIASSAIVNAGRDLTFEAEDTTETIFTAGAIGGAGVVGVGVNSWCCPCE